MAQPQVRRSLLVVSPLDDGALLEATRSHADAVVVDLAGRTSQGRREEARRSAHATLQRLAGCGAELLLWTDPEDAANDLAACAPGSFAGVLATADGPEAVARLDAALGVWESTHGVPQGTLSIELALASAKAVHNADRLAAASPRIVALALDEERLMWEMGMEPADGPDRLLYHRGRAIIAARAAGMQAHGLGGVSGPVLDRAEAGRQAGLRGALCFDPWDAAALNAGFSPTSEELEAARRVVAAMRDAVDGGRGAIAVSSGQMADLANIRGAQAAIAWGDAVRQRDTAARQNVNLA